MMKLEDSEGTSLITAQHHIESWFTYAYYGIRVYYIRHVCAIHMYDYLYNCMLPYVSDAFSLFTRSRVDETLAAIQR